MLKVSVWICMHIRLFCWQSFVFPSFQFYTQTTEEDDVGKHWRTITFRQDHAIHLKNTSHFVVICLRANRGECQHAVCHEGHEKNSKAQRRSHCCVLREDELIKSCRHKLPKMQICANMWWYTRDHLGGLQWFDHPKGFAFCEKMFNAGHKWMRMFASGKLVVSYFRSPGRVSWECVRMSIFSTQTDDGGLIIVMFWLCRWMLLCHLILQSEFSRDFNRL
jgi:hypothetical protein